MITCSPEEGEAWAPNAVTSKDRQQCNLLHALQRVRSGCND